MQGLQIPFQEWNQMIKVVQAHSSLIIHDASHLGVKDPRAKSGIGTIEHFQLQHIAHVMLEGSRPHTNGASNDALSLQQESLLTHLTHIHNDDKQVGRR